MFDAERLYHKVLSIDSRHSDSLHLLGIIAHQVGRNEAAIELIGKAIALNGRSEHYHSNLGLVLQALGRLDDAIAAFHTAIRIAPDAADAHFNLGVGLQNLERFEDAARVYKTVLRLRPDDARTHSNLGGTLKGLGQLDSAVAAFRTAILIAPDYAEAYSNLGLTLKALGQFDDAVIACRAAVRIKPNYAEAYSNLGLTLKDMGRLDDAVAAFNMVIRLKPDYAEAYSNLGIALQAQGRLDDAIAAFRTSIRLKPDFDEAYSNLLMALHYGTGIGGDAILAEARRFAERFERHARDRRFANAANPARRLRIGYVSADFREHSVAWFLEPVLLAHNHREFEVFCYSAVARPDSVTKRFQGLADHWRNAVGLSDEALAKAIRQDSIDILVDLGGHTADNRLAVFARKPAPIQVSWLGYPGTTGLAAMDYRLVDSVTDPDCDGADQASETLFRLPDGFLCYGPPDEVQEPAVARRLDTPVTFGSFNNPAKLSRATLDAWAALLVRLPNARLLLKGSALDDAATCIRFLDALSERGVAKDRIELVGYLPSSAEHLALYRRIDVALDPFPYNGTTTTCEALWMGIPVVSLRGNRHSGRVGASLLTRVGLEELIARDVEDYVQIAATLAADGERLDGLRRSLRQRMAASPLCDGPAFTRKLEAAFRTMWQTWCDKAKGKPLGAGRTII